MHEYIIYMHAETFLNRLYSYTYIASYIHNYERSCRMQLARGYRGSLS